MAPKVWLITGASSGLGLELVKIASAAGVAVIAASRNPKKMPSVKGVTAAYLDHNESFDKVQAAVQDILAIHGTIDVVVNNAAYVQTGMVEEASPEETYRQFNANLFGPTNVYRAVLPHLREKRAGTLVTIGSMAAWYPMPSCNLYNASKAAMRWISIGMADEVAGFGIKHMLVEPGFFRTALLQPGANLSVTDNTSRIPDYAELNATADGNFKAFNGNQAGDPVKGAQIIFDVITSTGVAQGRKLPGFLPLGSDANTEIVKSAEKTIKEVNEWASIAAQSDITE